MSKPTRSPDYLSYIRSLSCLLEGKSCRGPVEAAHTGGHGMGQKADDRQTIPLCRFHHRYLHELGPRQFELRYNLSIRDAIAHLNAKPRLTLEGGNIVARIEGQEYVVGPFSIGWSEALKRVSRLWWEDRKDVQA